MCADTADFSFATKWSSNSQTVGDITVTFGGATNPSHQTGYTRIKRGATISFSAGSDKNITAIAVTYTSDHGKNLPSNGVISSSPTGINNEATSWTGSATSEVVFTVANVSGNEFDVTGITVTYTDATPTEFDYIINIADLRFEHLTYDPSRTGIYGFDITATGWQSQTTGDEYSLLVSPSALSTNSFTVAVNGSNSSTKITQMVIAGDEGAFANVSAIRSANTYETTNHDQIIWQNTSGASSATIEFTSSDRPKFMTIYVKTDAAMAYSKQTPSLSFDPALGTADPNITDYQIDGRLKMGDQYFRADSYTIANTTSNSEINQFHLSTGKVGVNTGSAAGTATITANFNGDSNPFYNTASANYTLTINEPVTTENKTITIDDMRYSKVANSNGLNANSGLNRSLGGFDFTFTGGEGVKYNNGDGIIIRKTTGDSPEAGILTITPKNSGTGDITITRVDIVTYPSSDYTNGVFTVSGLATNQEVNNVSSYSFANLNSGNGVNPFTIEAVSGTVYIKSFTIYYTLPTGATLNETKVTPTFTWNKASDDITSGEAYTSPVLTVTPSNFDCTITNSNTDVATVKSTNRITAPLITLSGEDGTATITASAAESTFFNEAENAVYTVNVTPTTASEKWNFTTLNVGHTINTTEWNDKGDYYQNNFTAAQNSTYSTANTESQIYELLFARNNSNGLEAGQIRLFSSYMTFTNSSMVIKVPVTTGQKVLVTFDGGNGDTEAGFKITGATVDGDASATKILSDATQKIATLTATADGYVTLETTKSKVKLYSIQVKSETRKNLDLRDAGSNTYEKEVGTGTTSDADNHFNHRVVFTAAEGLPITYDADATYFTITSSDPSVLDVSNAYIAENSFGNSSTFYFNNIIPKAAGTATLTITFAGNENYLPTSYTSTAYTVYGPTTTYLVSADNQEIQQGQFSNITPKITDADGNLLGIRLMNDGTRYTTYVLGEEEDEPDYSEYFTFEYAAAESGTGTNWNKITVNSSTGKIETGDGSTEAAVGATRKITVTATPKAAYSSAFSTTKTTELTVTIIEKTANIQVDFYWDAACTEANKITLGTKDDTAGTDNTYDTTNKINVFSADKFENGFPNGRVIYAKPKNEGDAIWFSYAQGENAAVIPANPTIDKKKRVFQYRRGIPIYIDDDLSGIADEDRYISLCVVATTYDANTKKYNLRGTVARLKFPKIVSHDRPAQPTYDPISPDVDASLNKDGRKIMNTAENVVAYGEGASKTNPTGNGTLVYGKFSTGTVYTTEQLINEKAVQNGTGSVPVVSTEVAKRRFTSVQIKNYAAADDNGFGGGDYISEQTYTEYWYLYDTDLRLYSDPERTTAYPNQNINVNTSTALPYYKVMWYNKKNYDDPSNYNLGEAQEVSDYAGKITYAITDYGTLTASDVSIDASTGIVTSNSANEGRIKVTATYLGGEQHGGKSSEPQYTSTTDESTADFYVYIYDANKEVPTITPQSRNFTGMMTYTITAPENWDVVYTTDGTNPVVPSSGTPATNYIAHTGSVSKKIGESTATITVDFAMADGDVHTVKAIAYNPDNRSLYSVIVSEAYTKKAPIPSPTFDPSGVAEPYQYNTNELTVQIACAYPSAVIYYTTDGTEPVIGASNTYKYSGLSKVVISGNVTITAVAYDPVQQIYSPIVPSRYVYSSVMNKPYFQISDDGGNTWLGLETEGANSLTANGKKWYGGESFEITPSTQIRIVDPNPVTGTIFYTLDNTTPADNATTMVYAEGYPFTVGKTVTGKAITILEDAKSDVSSAVFTIPTATYGNVWEAVNETTTSDTPYNKTEAKRGIYAAQGFTISTKPGLVVSSKESGDDNNGYTVNKNSIQGEANSNGGTTSKMYAQADITATFGGKMPKDEDAKKKAGKEWIEMTIADAAIGAPIDAVGTYSLKNDDNARSENGKNFMHAYMFRTDGFTEGETPQNYEKTFRVPTQGDYVRFEPEKDGDLTIWVLQQGALLYEDDTYFVDNVLRVRPVYLIDEQGNSQKVKVVNNVPQMWSSARLSENWAKIQATAAKTNGWMDSKYLPATDKMSEDAAYTQYLRVSDGALYSSLPAGGTSVDKLSDIPSGADKTKYYKKLVNKGPNRAETEAIYQMYKADLDKNYVNIGDPIKPFAIHTGSTLSLNDGHFVDNSDDQTGYVLASGGYAKYTFEVKAGKTYYFLAQGSKIGVRGFQFVPTSTKEETITLNDNGGTSNMDAINNAKAEKTQVVTLNAGESARSFAANQWTTLLLPFSMSETQVSQTFGQNTRIIHFSHVDTETRTLHLGNHCYDMIVAGTPVLICPTKAATLEGFKTHIERTVSAESALDGDGMSDGTRTFNGSYSQAVINKNDMFINNTGEFKVFTGANGTNYKNCRAWISGFTSAEEAKSLSIIIDNGDVDDETTTSLRNALIGYDNAQAVWTGPAMVYNTKGQLVRRNSSSLEGLPAGIYIVKSAEEPNGRKFTVK